MPMAGFRLMCHLPSVGLGLWATILLASSALLSLAVFCGHSWDPTGFSGQMPSPSLVLVRGQDQGHAAFRSAVYLIKRLQIF